MNILLIQENGRHEKNRNYRECFCLKRAFETLGHSSDIWGLGHENFQQTPIWENYDIILNLENYDETGWVPSLRSVKTPKKILWSIDAHCRGEEIFEKTFREGKYDILLHSTKDFVTKNYHLWFPNAYDDTLIKPLPNIEKKYEIGFCGNWVNRRPILEWLRDNYNVHLDIFVIGYDMVKAINSYKCQFNLNIANDINYRSFETIGCGTLLLTNSNPQYQELGFIDTKNCLIYSTKKDLTDKINFIKNNDIQEIQKSGIELAKKHSYKERVKKLLNDLEGKFYENS